MDREEALKMLRGGSGGIDTWNRKRSAGEDIPDLSGADLQGAYLVDVNLKGINLSRANLNNATLVGMKLGEVNLDGAHLRQADLRAAHLGGAKLNEANLEKALLIHTYLREAELNKANLNEANIKGASLRSAKLAKADLRGADLSSADLRDADLRQAELQGAKLRNAKLSKADISSANLTSADLTSADLHEARLAGAILIDATLREAVLQRADLCQAALIRADLSGADLSESDLRISFMVGANLTRASLARSELESATFGSTVLVDVDLSGAKGLEDIRHEGPSPLGTETLFLCLSEYRTPDTFLHGCGVDQRLIDVLRKEFGLTGFHTCFISYSHHDEGFAQRLRSDLLTKGVRCWFAPEDLKIGERIRVGIDEAIHQHDKLLLVLSGESIASDWVENEVETAMEKERRQKRTVLFPIRLDDAVMEVDVGWAAHIRKYNIGDFRTWKDHDAYQRAFDRLLRNLKDKDSTGKTK